MVITARGQRLRHQSQVRSFFYICCVWQALKGTARVVVMTFPFQITRKWWFIAYFSFKTAFSLQLGEHVLIDVLLCFYMNHHCGWRLVVSFELCEGGWMGNEMFQAKSWCFRHNYNNSTWQLKKREVCFRVKLIQLLSSFTIRHRDSETDIFWGQTP